MATINITYDPGVVVYHLTEDCGVEEALVVKVTTMTLLTNGVVTTTIVYSIRPTGLTTTKDVGETTLYVDLPTAIAAYQATF